jgi:hypothetical protein
MATLKEVKHTKTYWEQYLFTQYPDIATMSTQLIDNIPTIVITKLKNPEEMPDKLQLIRDGLPVPDQYVQVKTNIGAYPVTVLTYQDCVNTMQYWQESLLNEYKDIATMSPELDENQDPVLVITRLKNPEEVPDRLQLVRNGNVIDGKFIRVKTSIGDYPIAC